MTRRLFEEDAGTQGEIRTKADVRQEKKEISEHAKNDAEYAELAVEMGLPIVNAYAIDGGTRVKVGGLELFFSYGAIIGFKWRNEPLRLSMNPQVRGISTQRHLEALERQYGIGIRERIEVDQFREEMLRLLELLRIT